MANGDEVEESRPQKSAVRRAADFAWFLIKDQWFLIGIAVVTIIASQVQVPLEQQDVKQVVVSYLSGRSAFRDFRRRGEQCY